MKKLLACLSLLSVILVGFSAHAAESNAAPSGSFGMGDAQQEFNTQVYNLLQGNRLDELEQLVKEMPDCRSASEKEMPEKICTKDRMDGQKYVRHINLHKSFPSRGEENVVCVDCGIYEGLTGGYKAEYGEPPFKLNAKAYRAFYDKYKYTWLAPFVEETMTQLWQSGRAYDGMTSAGVSFGDAVYTTLYVSSLAGFDDIFKYVSPRLYIYKHRAGASYGYLLGFFMDMERMSRRTNSPELWRSVKQKWLSSLLEPEVYSDADYYQGRKQKSIIEFFNKFGWSLFVTDGYTPTQWQRHTATLYGRACERMTNLAPKACELYREGINKYGINEDLEKQQEIQQTISKEILFALQDK